MTNYTITRNTENELVELEDKLGNSLATDDGYILAVVHGLIMNVRAHIKNVAEINEIQGDIDIKEVKS